MIEKIILEQSEITDKIKDSNLDINVEDKYKCDKFLGDDRLDENGKLEENIDYNNVDKKFLQLFNELKMEEINDKRIGEDIGNSFEKKVDKCEYNIGGKKEDSQDKIGKIQRDLYHSTEISENSKDAKHDNGNEATDVNLPIKNKMDGLAREKEVAEELEKKYPKERGYDIISEAYLRDKDGHIVRDPETGEARRVDFVVVKDGKVVDSVEVTSMTADKVAQNAKEKRIRDVGGNYIRDDNGNLVEIPFSVQTRIERRN